MKIIASMILGACLIMGVLHAESQPCRKCVEQYDGCLSDLFQGLGSMDGDDIKNCQSARDACLEDAKK